MASSNPAKVLLASCLLLALSMQMCSSSAIPIWEFLTRNEKMSYLYSTFAQLVSVHCKATAATAAVPVNQCKRNLLSYGYEKLQTFSEAQLESLDPYQREANELIWTSIMRDHASATLVTTRKPQPTPPASSLIILTHQQSASTSASVPQYPRNPLFDGSVGASSEQQHNYAMDMDTSYAGTAPALAPEQATTYLTGPLVIRVRPDGTPVEEDQFRPLPRDEDLEVFQMSTSTRGGGGGSGSDLSANGRPNRHRKIATISALKQQHFEGSALQRELQPPHVEQRRQQRQASSSGSSLRSSSSSSTNISRNPGYFYAKPQ